MFVSNDVITSSRVLLGQSSCDTSPTWLDTTSALLYFSILLSKSRNVFTNSLFILWVIPFIQWQAQADFVLQESAWKTAKIEHSCDDVTKPPKGHSRWIPEVVLCTGYVTFQKQKVQRSHSGRNSEHSRTKIIGSWKKKVCSFFGILNNTTLSEQFAEEKAKKSYFTSGISRVLCLSTVNSRYRGHHFVSILNSENSLVWWKWPISCCEVSHITYIAILF